MPKNIFKPDEFQDYKEDYLEGHKNSAVVLVGSQNWKYSKQIKREFTKHECLSLCYDELQKDKSSDLFVGRVFYPNRRYPKASFPQSYKFPLGNQAFIAGIVAAGRRVLLVTPIEHYDDFPTGTVNEIIWLDTFGYTLKRDATYPTKIWACPPKKLLTTEISEYIDKKEEGVVRTILNGILAKNSITRFTRVQLKQVMCQTDFVIQGDDFFDGLFAKTLASTEEKSLSLDVPLASSGSSSLSLSAFPSLSSSSSSSSQSSSSSAKSSSSSSSLSSSASSSIQSFSGSKSRLFRRVITPSSSASSSKSDEAKQTQSKSSSSVASTLSASTSKSSSSKVVNLPSPAPSPSSTPSASLSSASSSKGSISGIASSSPVSSPSSSSISTVRPS